MTLILKALLNIVDMKNSKVYFQFKSTCRSVGNQKTGRPPPAAPAQSLDRHSYQYLRLLSPSDMLFIVKSGTSLDLPCMPALEDSFNSPRQCEVYRIITGA